MLPIQNLNLHLRAEAAVIVVYTRNWYPTNVVQNMTPQEAWTQTKPCIANMSTFGCISFAKVLDSRVAKFQAKAKKYLFLGYTEGTEIYRLMSVETKKII